VGAEVQAGEEIESFLRGRPRFRGVDEHRLPWIGRKLEGVVAQGEVADKRVVDMLAVVPAALALPALAARL
jgi:hypothetical protein